MEVSDVLMVLDGLEAEGVRSWIDGGWGVDALAGTQTRGHEDLDLVVQDADCRRAERVLAELGYVRDSTADPGLPARLVVRDGQGHQVDLHPIVRDQQGNGWQPLGNGAWGAYPADGLIGVGTVGDRRVHTLTPELQLRHHLGYPNSENDRHDLQLLAEQFGLCLPPGLIQPVSEEGSVDDEMRLRLTQDCPECGFVYHENEAGSAAGAILDGAGAIASRLVKAGDGARTRPEPETWSALEYGCHVRDVLLVQRERVLLARRAVEPPRPPPMGREERAEHDDYAGQRPDDVARQLQDAAQLLANVLDCLDQPSWTRTLIYNFPAPQERSLRWVAVHTVHEVRHHLLDVRRGLSSD